MGTGIVSIALSLDGHHETISRVLLVLDGVIWVGLAVLLPARAGRDRARFRADVCTPAALTVAGSAVLGTRLTVLGWDWAGVALLVIAFVLWTALLVPVLAHWRKPTVGASPVLVAAIASFGLGLAFYVFVISRFDLRQIAVGRGDHWITGGALAISTLAAGRITTGAETLALLGAGGGTLKSVSLGLWVLTMLWPPVLLLAEALRDRATTCVAGGRNGACVERSRITAVRA